jgi:hypothetical protein
VRILNQTGFPAEFTSGMDVAGREYLSLVVKGTYAFPDTDRDAPAKAAEQRPLVKADECTGAPGFSATLWETDFAFRKTMCDVVAQGAAYAPGDRPAERVRVGLRVGDWVKQFDVVGAREWRVLGPAVTATRPLPFRRMPFSYDTAFGGVDALDPDDDLPAVYEDNPVGTGFAAVRNQSRLSGLPLPNTEEVGQEVLSPYGSYRPMALGPVGRGWPERRRYAGTYDDHWKDNVFPFLPADFDERYYQMAPADQQIPPPAPGTPVIAVGLTPRGREAFRLPDTALPLRVFRGREVAFDGQPLPDTLAFDTEARQFMLTWRISVPMKRIITEFTEAWIGPPTEAMLRARREGRAYIRAVATGPAPEDEP